MNHNFTADGTHTVDHFGGPLTVQAVGDWGGGTLAIQYKLGSNDGTTEYEMSADETQIFDFEPCQVDLVLSGATAPNIDVELRP